MNQFKFYQLVFLLVFATPQLSNGQNNATNIRKLIDSLNKSLDNHYVFPGKAKNISQYLQSQLKKNVYAAYANNPQTLAEKIDADVKKAHYDPHMRILFDPGFVPQKEAKPSEEEISRTKKYWKENNYLFRKVEVLAGNIGYLPLTGFVNDVENAKSTIYGALKFLSNTNAIIIDLRENRGGSPDMVSQLESYFFKEKTRMNDFINRSAKDTILMYADPAKADSLNLSMPVYILTSQKTFSAAEDFSYGMQAAKRGIIVGETTGGGAHPVMPFSVGQGFVALIPFSRSYNHITQTDWEGTGVIPDEKIEAKEALLKAQELIFKAQILGAKDESEKRKNEYYLNLLLLKEDTNPLPQTYLAQLTGTYNGLVVYLENGKLMCKNTNNGNAVSELKHITNNLFVLDKKAQIEFIKNSAGNFSSVKIFVNDGSVFEELKK